MAKFQLVVCCRRAAEKPVYHINVDRTLARIVVAAGAAADVCFCCFVFSFRIFVMAKPIYKSLQQSNKRSVFRR